MRAYSSMEFGYAAALALILTLLPCSPSSGSMFGAPRGISTDDGPSIRRETVLEVELVLAILAFALATLCLDGPDIHQAPGGAFALAGPLSPGERRLDHYRSSSAERPSPETSSTASSSRPAPLP